MPRGKPSPDGSTYTAKNRYHYTKQDGKWRLTHHIIMEEILGRPLAANESVRFIDGDRTNRKPSNLKLNRKHLITIEHRIEVIDGRIAELQSERQVLLEQLEASKV